MQIVRALFSGHPRYDGTHGGLRAKFGRYITSLPAAPHEQGPTPTLSTTFSFVDGELSPGFPVVRPAAAAVLIEIFVPADSSGLADRVTTLPCKYFANGRAGPTFLIRGRSCSLATPSAIRLHPQR